MAHTDKQLRAATQVAYVDFGKMIENLGNSGDKSYTIRELLIANRDRNVIDTSNVGYIDSHDQFIPADDAISSEILDWKIVDYYDNNGSVRSGETGFYGCVIETSKEDAIVAFRGSEDAMHFENLVADWLKSDLSLLKGDETIQQEDVSKYAKYMNETGILDSYKEIDTTGHSLGGNLAYHYGVTVAEEYPKLYDKLSKVVNFDGPGMASEYLENHRVGIEKMKDNAIHYRWSLVGACLEEFPGVEPIFLDTKKPKDEVVRDGNETVNLVAKHSTKYLYFDENGTAQRGEIDPLAYYVDMLTSGLDHMPSEVGNATLSFLSFVVENGIPLVFEIQDGEITSNLTDEGKMFVGGCAVMIGGNFYGSVPFLLDGALSLLVAPVVYECMYEDIYPYVQSLASTFSEKINLVKKDIEDSITKVCTFWNGYRTKYVSNINSVQHYVTENPSILVNTNRLREYANRIQNVNDLITSIDKQLDVLYFQVGLLDLWNIVGCDLLTGYSWRLQKAQEFLTTTADEFDVAEKNIREIFE